MKWIPYVMVRVTAFLIVGVLTGIYFPAVLSFEVATVFLVILCTVYLIGFVALKGSRAIRMFSGIVGLGAIFLSGYLVVFVRTESEQPHAVSQIGDTVQAYQVRILTPAERKAKSWRRTGEVERVLTRKGWRTCTGKLLLYWPLSERADTLHYGDRVLVRGTPVRIQGPFNPGEFDYRAYLAQRNIFHQHRVQPGNWVFMKGAANRGPMYYAHEARRWTLAVIEATIRGERAQAIMGAFVIGVTDGIDDDLKQAYASGGAMHALAVSGMHVSILYGVLLFLLKPLEARKGGLWAIAIISLVVLWMYGFVTGLSASVLRAVAMFSFLALAKPLGKTTSILNTLAASAFFLLLFDPWLICAAGFQLSYLAVLGIVLLYRPVYNLLEMPWAWADWIWQITCVSIAAQIATLPVTLYYFHQFPLYFLLANLFVIPASTLILLGGILLLAVNWIPVVSDGLSRLLELLIWLLNEGLFIVGQLPSSVIAPIPFSLLQSFCLGAMVISVYRLFRSLQFRWVMVLAFFAVGFAAEDWRHHAATECRFLVHRIMRHASLEWHAGSSGFSAQDSLLMMDPRKLNFHVSPDRLAERIDRIETKQVEPTKGVQYYTFQGKSFLRISLSRVSFSSLAKVDYLIIGNNAVMSLETLRRSLTFGYVILDSSNSPAYEARLLSEANKLGVPCHPVLKEGAFVTEWRN